MAEATPSLAGGAPVDTPAPPATDPERRPLVTAPSPGGSIDMATSTAMALAVAADRLRHDARVDGLPYLAEHADRLEELYQRWDVNVRLARS